MYLNKNLSNTVIWLIALHIATIHGQNHEIDFKDLKTNIVNQYADEFSFSIIVQFDSTVVFDLENNRSLPKNGKGKEDLNHNLLFNIASISKSITAAGILKLEEEELIDVENTIDTYFEEVPEDKKEIRIFDLLIHQSGLGQTYPCEGINDGSVAFRIIMEEQLANPPGSSFVYSNQNYQLLALLIEQVTGKDYSSYIKEAVLQPLGMDHTILWEEAKPIHYIAQAPKRIKKSMGKKNWAWIGATGIFSSSKDLLKFWNGIFNTPFLNVRSKTMMLTPHYITSSGLGIGYGFYHNQDTQWDTPEFWTRGTESWGHNAVIRHFPEKKVSIIVLSNSGEIGGKQGTGNRLISSKIADYIFTNNPN